MIYFLEAPDSGRIKIGTTNNLVERMKNLRETGGPELNVLGVMDGGRKEENRLHLRFTRHRLAGEWFSPSPDLLEFIRTEARPWQGPKIAPDGGPSDGAVLAENLIRLGYVEVRVPVAKVAKVVSENSGTHIGAGRLSQLLHSIRISPETWAALAKGLGVKPEELRKLPKKGGGKE